MDHFALFPSHLFILDIPGREADDRELAERLLAERAASPGFLRSNVGGWHSVPDLSQRPERCYRRIMQEIVDATGSIVRGLAGEAGIAEVPEYRYALQAWAMVMGAGDYTVAHDHGDAHWSSAYYVDIGDADIEAHPRSGAITFLDPGRGGRAYPGLELFPPTFEVTPRPGMLVLFPGRLQHYVHAYRGARPRISISCNVTLAPAGPGR